MTQTRVALGSGANRGIGREIVRQLARLGVVAVIGARDHGKGDAAAATLKTEGLDADVVTLDVTSADSARAAVAEVVRRHGRLDILVNNAGICIDGPSSGAVVGDVGEDVMMRTFDTNVLGPLRLIQAALPHMKAQGYGRIVNLSSGLGQLDTMAGGWPAYRSSKTALNALTRACAADVAGSGIKVNAMCPGWVKTDMGGPDAERSIEQGADTAVYLAMLEDAGASGGFFRDRKPIAW